MPLTNYHRNKLIDYWYRGESYAQPSSLWAALLSAATASSHTEVTAGGVARVEISCSTSNWSGTQGDGTTSASSGTTGTTSNNNEIEFVSSAGATVTASHVGIFNAASSGNLLEYVAIRDGAGNAITRSWGSGDRVVIPASSLRFTWS